MWKLKDVSYHCQIIFLHCNKGYCSLYEGFKHAPFSVWCLIVILVVNVETEADTE